MRGTPKAGHLPPSENWSSLPIHTLLRERELFGSSRPLTSFNRQRVSHNPGPQFYASSQQGEQAIKPERVRPLHPRGLRSLERRRLQTHMHFHASHVRRLQEDDVLEGHRGCVNRLRWSDDGSLLASVSDDRCAILWKYGSTKPLQIVQTKHRANLFGIRFMPNSENRILVTGAMDNLVQVHRLDAHVETSVFVCHQDRVKDIEVDPSSSNIFWSASEDGTIRQFDLRVRHDCSDGDLPYCGSNILINILDEFEKMPSLAHNSEPGFKSIHVNGVNPFLLVTACRDQFVRIYDRRMLSVGSEGSSAPISYLSPKHLCQQRGPSVPYTTCASFSPDGSQVLANYSCEQIYLFDAKASSQEPEIQLQRPIHECYPYAIEMKGKGNDLYVRRMFSDAISSYSSAINILPDEPTLYSNRSIAHQKRKWDGDMAASLLDAEKAIELNPKMTKAYYRKATALLEMRDFKKAALFIEESIQKFPEDSEGFNQLKEKYSQQLTDSTSNPDEEQNDELLIDPSLLNDSSVMIFSGRVNQNTDIKEACFMGRNGDYIVAGSDDGCVYIWEHRTGALVRVMETGDSIINCVQAHPFDPVLAVSGIEDVVKLYRPTREYADPAPFPSNIGKYERPCVIS